MSVEDIALELEGMDYYQTVTYEYILEAVRTAVAEVGRGRSVEEYHQYISNNLI